MHSKTGVCIGKGNGVSSATELPWYLRPCRRTDEKDAIRTDYPQKCMNLRTPILVLAQSFLAGFRLMCGLGCPHCSLTQDENLL